MRVSVVLGAVFPIAILVGNFELSQLTLILWPSMLGLMALGGKISSVGDYLYVVFLILINIAVYALVAKLIIFLFSFSKEK